MSFTHNPNKKRHRYHIATLTGTLCKMENSIFYRLQVVVDTPPAGKTLCILCQLLKDRTSNKPCVCIEGFIQRETNLAIQIEIGVGKKLWIPKCKARVKRKIDTHDDIDRIYIPIWLARNYGIEEAGINV